MAKKNKKRLSKDQEFEIMKLVLDKFLWLGFGIMVVGMYVMFSGIVQPILTGLAIMIAGAVILVLLMLLLIKEYEFLK